jgi:hypothetical protein
MNNNTEFEPQEAAEERVAHNNVQNGANGMASITCLLYLIRFH